MKNRITNRIILRALRAEKLRNFFVVAAVALTTFMITAVLSVGVSMHETMQIIPLRSEGMRTHADLSGISPAQLDFMRSLDYIQNISVAHNLGMGFPTGFDGGVPILTLTEESWRFFQTPAFTEIVGNFATAENEIMLSRAHLAAMGIAEPFLGMEISMDFIRVDNADDFRKNQTFRLSLIYTDFVSTNIGNMFTPIFVSTAFAENHGLLIHENALFNVIFTNQNRAEEFTNRLASDLALAGGTENLIIAVHPSLENQQPISPTAYIALAVIVIFFMFVGFLLIYNVMYISVSKDVQFYGMLKTMGATPKQLRRIVNGQVLILYFIGLPIGLAVAVLTSFAIIPSVLDGVQTGVVISFSPIIFLGGAAFALLTVYLGASVSAATAAKISPISAIRYTGEKPTNISVRGSAQGKSHRLAWRNIFREKRRAFVVMLSLFLGISVFSSVMSLANSMDITGSLSFWYPHDIQIQDGGGPTNDLGLVGMDRDFIAQIAEIPGITEIMEHTHSLANVNYPQMFVGITGIDNRQISEISANLETPIDIAAFERGEIAFLNDRFTSPPLDGASLERGEFEFLDIEVADFIGTEIYFEIGQEARIPVSTEIVGEIALQNNTGLGVGFGALEIVMSSVFLDSISAKGGTVFLGINIADGMEESVNAAVSALVATQNMAMASAWEARQQHEDAQLTMFVLGASIAGILALIGIFNFINLIAVGLFVRKRELATFESVGMSRKQQRRMLRWEGIFYWILSLSASATAGTGLAYGLFWLVSNQDPILLPRFVFPSLPVAVVFGIIVAVCTITPEVCYRGVAKSSLVERLREV